MQNEFTYGELHVKSSSHFTNVNRFVWKLISRNNRFAVVVCSSSAFRVQWRCAQLVSIGAVLANYTNELKTTNIQTIETPLIVPPQMCTISGYRKNFLFPN